MLISPLGSLGDSLFWKSWRPFCGVLGSVLFFMLGWIGPVVYCILYNTLHLYVRLRGLLVGYSMGRESLVDLNRFLYR